MGFQCLDIFQIIRIFDSFTDTLCINTYRRVSFIPHAMRPWSHIFAYIRCNAPHPHVSG